ncbi:MAG: hypothetical protein JRI68_00465 [Deltaproteobacteria bacterium]|nr:hypothetical protein [Deltaproteobacteria bacterium]
MRKVSVRAVWAGLGLAALGCGSPTLLPPPVGGCPPQVGRAAPPAGATSATTKGCPAATAVQPDAAAKPGDRLALGLEQTSLALGEGRWAVKVTVPAARYVTIGVAGPAKALVAFDVIGDGALRRLRTGAVKDDGLLPAFLSFETPAEEQILTVVVDVEAPVTLLRVAADPTDIGERSRRALRLGKAQPRLLVGLPAPIERRAGYLFQMPQRYAFLRADVAAALRAALRQTKIRFKGNGIAIGDATQWNGDKPASDRGKPRHIHHDQGRDIDLGLPSSDDSPSLLQRRCEGVLVEKDELKCGPGTVQNLGARRLAYFLGLLIDGPTPGGRHVPDADRRSGPLAEVESILTDQAYVDEIRKALPALRRKRWIHDEAFGALGEEGLLRPSSWHTDHVHITFKGESALVPEALRFEAQPPPGGGPSAPPKGR